MVDERIRKLADILVNYSLKIEKKDVIQLNFDLEAKDLALEVYKGILKKGAYVKLNVNIAGFDSVFYDNISDEQMRYLPKLYLHEAKMIDGIITINARNHKDIANISPDRISGWQRTLFPLSEIRFKKNNWVLCGYPSVEGAEDAGMSLSEFEDFVFSATNIDWAAMSKRQDLLKSIVDKGKNVRIVGEGTDLTFSIKGNKGVKCDGKCNMPDGEVFTSPRKNSVNGRISFNFPTVYMGKEVSGVVLEFKDGKVVGVSAAKNEAFLREMLETDEGAKYLGEFGIGVNYSIKKFIKNILFDEKIGGTIHLALGMAYKEAGGKNESAIHWDMITRPEKVFIDDKLILKDGEFMF